jgi:hypothetical protein
MRDYLMGSGEIMKEIQVPSTYLDLESNSADGKRGE